jgi:hypothetical protein
MPEATWLPVEANGPDAFARVFRLRPELYDGYRTFHEAVARESGIAAGVLARLAVRVGWLLGEGDVEPTAVDDAERALFALADKFVHDPHGVTDGDVAALRAHWSVPQIVGLVQILALQDGFTRFRLILAASET